MERCGICERDIRSISVVGNLSTDGHLLETGEGRNCDFWNLIDESIEIESFS